MVLSPSTFRLILVPLALLGGELPAVAQTAAHLWFEAPVECASQATFVAAVESRGGHFPAAQDPRPTMAVTIEKAEGGFVGKFQVQDASEGSTVREVRGTTCGEVVDALAVVTAIALNPGSEGRSSPTTPRGPAADLDKSPKLDASPNLREQTRFKGSSAWKGDIVEVPAGPLRFDAKLAWTVYYGATVGPVTSVIVPNLGVSFHLADFVTTPDGQQRIVGPILWARAGLSAVPQPNYRSYDTVTSITTQSAALGVCWSPLYDTRGLVLLGCVESGLTLVGFTTTFDKPSPVDGSTSQFKTGGFGTAGPLIDVEYNLGSWLHLAAKLGVNGVMGKATAERGDGSEIFHSKSWSVYGDFGIGVHF